MGMDVQINNVTDDKVTEYKSVFNEDNNAEEYLKMYYSGKYPGTDVVNPYHYRMIHEMLRLVPHKGKMFELGSGPTIATILLCAPVFDELYASDYSMGMIEPLKQWVNGQWVNGADASHFDHRRMVNDVSHITRIPPAELSTLTRSKVKGVIKSDMHNPKVLAPEQQHLAPFDTVIARFTLENSPDLESYQKAIRNVTGVLKKGGYFIHIGFYDHKRESWGNGAWHIGKQEVVDVKTTKKELDEAYEKAGLEVKAWFELRMNDEEREDFAEIVDGTMTTFQALLRKK